MTKAKPRAPKKTPPAIAGERHPGGRPSDYLPEYCDQVVEFMRAGFSLTAFAGHISVARSTINVWMEAHPQFSEAVSRGKASRLLHWEEAAINVAKAGGGPGSATIIVFGLKNMAPDEYSDTAKLEHTGKGGAPITVEDLQSDRTKNDLARRIAKLLRRGQAQPVA